MGNPVVIVWLLLALFGAGFVFSNLREARRDRRWARVLNEDPEVQIQADQDVRRETNRLITFLAFGGAVLVVIFVPMDTPYRQAATWLLVIGHAFVVLNSALDRYHRHARQRRLEQQRRDFQG